MRKIEAILNISIATTVKKLKIRLLLFLQQIDKIKCQEVADPVEEKTSYVSRV